MIPGFFSEKSRRKTQMDFFGRVKKELLEKLRFLDYSVNMIFL